MLTEMHNFVFKCTDFCRVHGNLPQNQVHKKQLPNEDAGIFAVPFGAYGTNTTCVILRRLDSASVFGDPTYTSPEPIPNVKKSLENTRGTTATTKLHNWHVSL